MKKIKLLPIILIVILTANLILFAVGKIPQLYFWIIIAVIGILAYKVLPKLKKSI